MQLLHGGKRVAARTAWRGLTGYGAVKHAQGRLSARRSPRTRVAPLVSGVAGLVAGMAIGSRLGGGCGHDHDHHHDHGDLPAASAGEQTVHDAPDASAA
jgi:hypothetical protein